MIYAIRDKAGKTINTIVASPDFVEEYCCENGFAYEEIEEAVLAPMPEDELGDSVWDELDAAYQEGVNSAYDS